MQVWQHNEMSADAGGLARWPVKLLIPVGFALLILQVLSEIGKRIIIMQGRANMTGDWGWLAPLMFAALFLLLLTGYPVAFVLAAVGFNFWCDRGDVGRIPIELVQAVPERLFGIMRNETLMAIPFFTLMGLILEKSQLAEDLLEAVNQLFGKVAWWLGLCGDFGGCIIGRYHRYCGS
jgi:hypothetical protein